MQAFYDALTGDPSLSWHLLLVPIFVAIQAWYARIEIVQAAETRFLERKLDICFENFDQAVALDTALRNAAPGEGIDERWPPLMERLGLTEYWLAMEQDRSAGGP